MIISNNTFICSAFIFTIRGCFDCLNLRLSFLYIPVFNRSNCFFSNVLILLFLSCLHFNSFNNAKALISCYPVGLECFLPCYFFLSWYGTGTNLSKPTCLPMLKSLIQITDKFYDRTEQPSNMNETFNVSTFLWPLSFHLLWVPLLPAPLTLKVSFASKIKGLFSFFAAFAFAISLGLFVGDFTFISIDCFLSSLHDFI